MRQPVGSSVACFPDVSGTEVGVLMKAEVNRRSSSFSVWPCVDAVVQRESQQFVSVSMTERDGKEKEPRGRI